jgi:hypothetical protein
MYSIELDNLKATISAGNNAENKLKIPLKEVEF